MKLLVFSDSHGADKRLASAISSNMDADGIIYLGDGERDIEYALAECNIYPYGSLFKNVFQVRGNCDIFSSEAASLTSEFDGIRILMTHGHAYSVKSGLEMLAYNAAEQKCSIALYGHTHKQKLSEINGVELFNPGALRNGSYGIIIIKNKTAEFSWENIS